MKEKDTGTTVIAITGGSCSGKSSLANEVASMLPGSHTIIVPLDSYYHDLSSLEFEMRAGYNFDHPDSIDFDMYERDLRSIASGRGALIPVYDYVTHTRMPREAWRVVAPRTPAIPRNVIAEGLHVLYREDTRALYDLTVFIEINLDTCLRRRIERDVRERGRMPAAVTEQFEKTVRPMYERYVLPCMRHADLVVDGRMPTAQSAAAVVTALEQRRS